MPQMSFQIKPAVFFHLLLLTALIGFHESFCQDTYQYDSGIIITQSEDTLTCLVPISFTYKSEIPIKLNGKIVVLPIDSIQYLSHSGSWFEMIEYKRKKKMNKKLMKVLAIGAINLYVNIPDVLSSNMSLEYFAKKQGTLHSFAGGSYKKRMATLISDSPPAMEYFIRSRFDVNKILEVVDYYNINKI